MDTISPNWTGSHLLICFPSPEPTNLLEGLSRKTGLRITWLETLYDPEDAGVFHDVDIIATLRAIPHSRANCPRLRYCHLLTSGCDYVSASPLFSDPGIRWTSSSGIHGSSIAEWVVMTYLAFEREYGHYREAQRDRTWLGDFRGMAHHRSLRGQRMGILGYGSIGRQIARTVSAFGVKVVVCTATPQGLSNERCRKASYAVPDTGDADGNIPTGWFTETGDRKGLHGFLAQSLDWLVVCVPLTARTKQLLTMDEFRILSRHSPRGGAFISNVARGDVIAQDDLIRALNSGVDGVRGAALDVQTPEPLPAGSPLWTTKNCFISPHISGQDDGYLERGLDIMLCNLRRSWNQSWVNEVDISRHVQS